MDCRGRRHFFRQKQIQQLKNQQTMKQLTTIIAFVLVAFLSVAQDKKMPSPPAAAEGKSGAVTVKIDYHQPSAKGRKIMGSLVPFGEVWRTGANETTTIEFDVPVKIEGKDVAKGKYSLFTIPGENEWTVIINKGIKWGAYTYKEGEDVLRVKVKPGKASSFQEKFVIVMDKKEVVLKWENTDVKFAIKG